MNTRTNRHGLATLQTTFEISGREELNRIIDKIRGIESVIDIERTTADKVMSGKRRNLSGNRSEIIMSNIRIGHMTLGIYQTNWLLCIQREQ